MTNTTEHSTPELLFFLIFKQSTRKFTLSHFGSQFQWSKQKQILTIKCVIPENWDAYCHGPPTFTREKVNWTDRPYLNVGYNMLFPPPCNTECVLKLWDKYAFYFGLSAWPRLKTCGLEELSTLNVPIPPKVKVILQIGFQICNQREKIH
jgi:hypothetical protein